MTEAEAEALLSSEPLSQRTRINFVTMTSANKSFRRKLERAQTTDMNHASYEAFSSEEVFRQMVAHVQEIFWMMDAGTRSLIYVSPAYEKICGRSLERLYSSPTGYHEVVHPEDRERMKERFQVLPKGAFSEEFRIVRPDGGIRWLSCQGFPVLDNRGEIIRLVGTAQDITVEKEATAALRASEDRYRDLVEHSQDLICTHDLEGNMLSVNEPPARILGFSPAELAGQPMQEFLAPEVRAGFEQYLETIRKDGVAHGLMVVLTRKGERRIWEYHNTLRTEGVPLPVVRGIAHDVTERKRAEKALRLSEEKFSKAFRASPTAMAITTLAEGRFLDVNDSFERCSGFSRAELCDQTKQEVGIWENPAEREQLRRQLQENGSISNREVRLRSKSGEVRHVLYSAELLELGGERCVLAAGEDITARKQAEEALRRSEANYRSLFDQAPYGIVRSTLEGRVLVANSALAKMLGYESEAELCALDIARDVYQHAEDRAHVIEECLSKEHFDGIVLRWKRKDGTPILVLASGRVVPDERGQIAYFEVMIEDITERTRLEQQLRQSQKMEAITLLAGGIAHDFNTLLTGILGYSERLLVAPTLAEEQRREAEEIMRAALQARSLTQQLLAFGRRQFLEPTVVNLNSIVNELEPMLRHLAGERIALTTTLEQELAGVEADARQLQQVLMNLVVNGRDAMAAGGRLTIRTENLDLSQACGTEFQGVEPGRYVMLTVTDTGCGMDEATKSRIFEPFFTTKPEGKGTGLGLSTVHGIIAQSGGQILVSSCPRKGSTFKILLPRNRLPNGEAQPRQIDGNKSRAGSRPTVLVVEDEDVNRKLVCSFLESQCTVLRARDATEGLEIAQQYPEEIDLLLTDVVLPGMPGTDLAERLTQCRPEMKVLYMTGYSDAMPASPDVLGPYVGVLQKPFLRSELVTKVEAVLGCLSK
jgi:two-component system cell cycle sensor histidine kinase/response regulator CckA